MKEIQCCLCRKTLLKFVKKWKFKSQVFVIFILTIVILITIVILLQSLHHKFIQLLLYDSSLRIFEKKALTQNSLLTMKYSNFFQNLLNSGNYYFIQFVLESLQLEMINKILLSLDKFRDSRMEQYFNIYPYLVKDLPQFLGQLNITFVNSIMCYGAYASNDSISVSQSDIFYLQIGEKLSQLIPTFKSTPINSVTLNVFLAFNVKEQLFLMYPCFHLNSSFRPFSRDWYKQQKESYFNNSQNYSILSEYMMSAPYQSFREKFVKITLTRNMISRKGEFLGVLASDLKLSDFSSLYSIKFGQNRILIAEKSGILLVHSYKVDPLEYTYIFNTTLSGFTQNDWQQMKNFAFKKTFNNTCQKLSVPSDLLCLRNNKSQDIAISLTYIDRFQYFIIILINEEEYYSLVLEQNEYLSSSLQQNLERNLYQIITCFLLILIIQIFVIHRILRPIDLVCKFALLKIKGAQIQLSKIRPNRKKDKKDQKEFNFGGNLQKLFESLEHLGTKQSEIKTDACKVIEEFTFPKKQVDFKKLSLEKIKVQCLFQQQLKNYCIPLENTLDLESKYELELRNNNKIPFIRKHQKKEKQLLQLLESDPQEWNSFILDLIKN